MKYELTKHFIWRICKWFQLIYIVRFNAVHPPSHKRANYCIWTICCNFENERIILLFTYKNMRLFIKWNVLVNVLVLESSRSDGRLMRQLLVDQKLRELDGFYPCFMEFFVGFWLKIKNLANKAHSSTIFISCQPCPIFYDRKMHQLHKSEGAPVHGCKIAGFQMLGLSSN